MNRMPVAVIGLVLGLSACVSEGKYDAQVKSAEGSHLECVRATSELQAQAKAERAQIAELGAKVQAADARLNAADAHEKELLRVVDDEKIAADTLRQELARTGENEALYKNLAMRLKRNAQARWRNSRMVNLFRHILDTRPDFG